MDGVKVKAFLPDYGEAKGRVVFFYHGEIFKALHWSAISVLM